MELGRKNTKIEITVYSGDTAQEGIKEIISNRLYVPGWSLRGCVLAEDYYEKKIIGIAYVGGVAVGTCTCLYRNKNSAPFVQVFVRKSLRKRGIGHKLLRETVGKEHFKYVEGLEGTEQFFIKYLYKMGSYSDYSTT